MASNEKVLGSGTVVPGVVYVASSSANDPPAGSPVIVTLEMPFAKATWRNSFGLLPASPDSAMLFEYPEVAVATWSLRLSNAAKVRGSA